MSSSMAFHLSFLKQGLLLNLTLSNSPTVWPAWPLLAKTEGGLSLIVRALVPSESLLRVFPTDTQSSPGFLDSQPSPIPSLSNPLFLLFLSVTAGWPQNLLYSLG